MTAEGKKGLGIAAAFVAVVYVLVGIIVLTTAGSREGKTHFERKFEEVRGY